MLSDSISLIAIVIGYIVLICTALGLILIIGRLIWEMIIYIKNRKQIIKKGTVLYIKGRPAILKRDLNIRYKKVKFVKCVCKELREDIFVGYDEITISSKSSRFHSKNNFQKSLLNKLIEDEYFVKEFIEWKKDE